MVVFLLGLLMTTSKAMTNCRRHPGVVIFLMSSVKLVSASIPFLASKDKGQIERSLGG